jgi:hypothetical protein
MQAPPTANLKPIVSSWFKFKKINGRITAAEIYFQNQNSQKSVSSIYGMLYLQCKNPLLIKGKPYGSIPAKLIPRKSSKSLILSLSPTQLFLIPHQTIQIQIPIATSKITESNSCQMNTRELSYKFQ